MRLEGGELSVDTTATDRDKSVVAKKLDSDSSKYVFSTTDGDELTQDGDGTFTLVHVEYKSFGDDAEVKWTLHIPVYVEKRLKIYSNMTMVEGIQYDTNKIKQNGKHVLTKSDTKNPMTLSSGNSYSIYAEYIYADALDKFNSLKIPKEFCIVTDSDVSFVPGTKITLIPLDEKGKPYYYEVTEGDGKEIDFTEFKAADGNSPYELQDIKSEEANQQDTYEDLCGKEYTDVVVESYVLLVDTSNATSDDTSGDTSNTTSGKNNALYEMHISPEKLWTNETDNSYYNAALSSRTDYNEHCYEYVQEIPGISYKINDDINDGISNTYLEGSISKGGNVTAHLQYDISADQTYWDSRTSDTTEDTTEDTLYLDIGVYLAVDIDGTITKLPLPSGTIISFGDENATSVVASDGQVYAYYYQGKNDRKETAEPEYLCINNLRANETGIVNITFDFSNADMSDLEAYYNYKFYIGAELVVTQDKELPAAGEVKDTWKAEVGAEANNDIGFALEVPNLMTLGMNQYNSEASDSGVVPYTASIAFPEKSTDAEEKDYTIVYQIEEKQKNADGTIGYVTYTGDDISLYLGSVTDTQSVTNSSDTINSGCGIKKVTYNFSETDITNGADLQNGQTPADNSTDLTPGVIKTHCTLVANCSGLDMTNYRVKAYLIVSSSTDENTYSLNTYLKDSELRGSEWSALDSSLISEDLKNDFFVFTVAKIKTSMQ